MGVVVDSPRADRGTDKHGASAGFAWGSIPWWRRRRSRIFRRRH